MFQSSGCSDVAAPQGVSSQRICHLAIHNPWRSHLGVDEHPSTYVDFHQGCRVLTHSHLGVNIEKESEDLVFAVPNAKPVKRRISPCWLGRLHLARKEGGHVGGWAQGKAGFDVWQTYAGGPEFEAVTLGKMVGEGNHTRERGSSPCLDLQCAVI